MPKGDKLTLKQKRFADKYLELGNATEAAAQTYDVVKRSTADVIGHENLAKPNLQAYLALHDNAAQNVVVEVMNNSSILKDEPAHASIALKAADSILDRLHGKATQRSEDVSTVVNINLDLTDST